MFNELFFRNSKLFSKYLAYYLNFVLYLLRNLTGAVGGELRQYLLPKRYRHNSTSNKRGNLLFCANGILDLNFNTSQYR
jgi:hypothetical protein